MVGLFARDAFHRDESFGHFWLHGLGVILAASAIMLCGERYHLFDQWEMVGLDTMLRHNPSSPSERIHIIEITDDDYDSLFGGQSPLNTGTLRNLIVEVAKGQPAIIAIDLDVSSSDLQRQIENELSKPEFEGKRPIVVWAQITERPKEGDAEIVLKQAKDGLPSDSSRLGVALFPLDADGVVRRYLREVEVSGNGGPRLRPTLPWAVFELAYPAEVAKRKPDPHAEDLIFNFTGDRYSFTITDVKSILSGSPPGSPPKNEPEWRKRELLKNKIVLIGGDFGAARDRYATPMGERAGVELIGHAIESEHRGGGITEVQLWLSILFDLVLGSMVLSFHYLYRPRKAVAFTLIAGLLLPLAGSLVLFRSFGYWLSFVPVVLGVLVHELYDDAKEGIEAMEEVHELREENERIKAELSAHKEIT